MSAMLRRVLGSSGSRGLPMRTSRSRARPVMRLLNSWWSRFIIAHSDATRVTRGIRHHSSFLSEVVSFIRYGFPRDAEIPMAKQVIHTDAAPKAIGTYSQAVRCGNTVYLAGQIALDPATMEL